MNAIRIPLLVVAVAAFALAQPFHPDIPRAWNDRDVAGFEIRGRLLGRGPLTVDTGGTGKIPLIAHSVDTFTMEGAFVEFVKDAKGAVNAMIQGWVEGDRKFARTK